MGAVVLLALFAAAAPSAPDGQRAFQRCYACHSVDPKEQGLPGPNLAGVVGRRAAALRTFDYSEAMRREGARGLIWSEAALDRFLADPEAVTPGTTMSMPPMRDPADRAAVIAYLKSPKPRAAGRQPSAANAPASRALARFWAVIDQAIRPFRTTSS